MSAPSQSNSVVEQYDERMRAVGIGPGVPRWYSPLAPPFALAGFAWLATDRRYRRLPVQPSAPLPPAVNELADCPAGGQLRFRTDSARLSIRVRLRTAANMVHMPATGQCGFDCYLGEPGQQRYCGTTKYPIRDVEYECALFDLPEAARRSVTLNFPLYAAVEEVAVGVDDGATLLPPLPFADDRRVIVYGTSITQGGCATRPGMAYTNILSRRFNREFINLGFSGSGKGEPAVARVIAEVPRPACYVLDYDANCVSTESLRQTLPEFIGILRAAQPRVPILVVSQVPFAIERHDPRAARTRTERLALQRETVEQLRRAGDRHLYFQDGAELLGQHPDEFAVDGVHPSDLGFQCMADALEPVLRKILAARG